MSTTCFLTNPYNPDGSLWEELQKITARVGPEDLVYLKRLLPFRHGVLDKILSTIFHQFIHELRLLEQSNGAPFEPAFYPEHPTEFIIANLLARLQQCGLERSTAGVDSGSTGEGLSPRNDAGGASSVHPALLPSTAVRSVQESGSD